MPKRPRKAGGELISHVRTASTTDCAQPKAKKSKHLSCDRVSTTAPSVRPNTSSLTVPFQFSFPVDVVEKRRLQAWFDSQNYKKEYSHVSPDMGTSASRIPLPNRLDELRVIAAANGTDVADYDTTERGDYRVEPSMPPSHIGQDDPARKRQLHPLLRSSRLLPKSDTPRYYQHTEDEHPGNPENYVAPLEDLLFLDDEDLACKDEHEHAISGPFTVDDEVIMHISTVQPELDLTFFRSNEEVLQEKRQREKLVSLKNLHQTIELVGSEEDWDENEEADGYQDENEEHSDSGYSEKDESDNCSSATPIVDYDYARALHMVYAPETPPEYDSSTTLDTLDDDGSSEFVSEEDEEPGDENKEAVDLEDSEDGLETSSATHSFFPDPHLCGFEHRAMEPMAPAEHLALHASISDPGLSSSDSYGCCTDYQLGHVHRYNVSSTEDQTGYTQYTETSFGTPPHNLKHSGSRSKEEIAYMANYVEEITRQNVNNDVDSLYWYYDGQLFNRLSYPQGGDLSEMARLIRFAQSPRQYGVPWRNCPAHVREMGLRSNYYGIELLRALTTRTVERSSDGRLAKAVWYATQPSQINIDWTELDVDTIVASRDCQCTASKPEQLLYEAGNYDHLCLAPPVPEPIFTEN
ncbi:hypothetical protein BDV96DRAFT_139446 [Lophiotrema nucula]|uniref:Uncharacterized protein n=1 Tax=Lophiotrema nucula TaxID=690887 RepID=A0A6A5ZV99_9PLEO|nr:hypothetical protein BDV96DRAFT_139446 [Lophiotrema nucula]